MLTIVLMIGSCAAGVVFADKIKSAISAPLSAAKAFIDKVRHLGG